MLFKIDRAHHIIGNLVDEYTEDEFKEKLSDYRIVDDKYYLIDFDKYGRLYSHDNLVDVFDTKLSYFASRCFFKGFQRMEASAIKAIQDALTDDKIIRAHNNDPYVMSEDLIEARGFTLTEKESWDKEENTILYKSFEDFFTRKTGLIPAYSLDSLRFNQMSESDLENFESLIIDGRFLDVVFSPQCCIKIEGSYKLI